MKKLNLYTQLTQIITITRVSWFRNHYGRRRDYVYTCEWVCVWSR